LAHIQRILDANQEISSPTVVDAIERGDALLLAAIDVPDDIRVAHIDLAIPALSLVRIDSFARRHGLTRATLLVEAVNRWSDQEAMQRERRAEITDGPMLFDFGNPPELRLEPIASVVDPLDELRTDGRDGEREIDDRGGADDLTAELARLVEKRSEFQPTDSGGEDTQNTTIRKAE
jgi:hypothetical protein